MIDTHAIIETSKRVAGRFYLPTNNRTSARAPILLDKDLANWQVRGFLLVSVMSKRKQEAQRVVYVRKNAYIGYSTNDVSKACDLYFQATGHNPKVVIARPEFDIINASEIVIYSYLGAAGSLLVSHCITADEVRRHKTHLPQAESFREQLPEVTDTPRALPNVRPGFSRKIFESNSSCVCPHCKSEIASFESLGYWYGWALGIYPPYWDDIRAYVFERDNYTCQKCGERKIKSNLRAHHIKPKEEYGTDSARNLVTLCAACHPDEHPIYSDDEKETLEVLGKSIPEGEVWGLAL